MPSREFNAVINEVENDATFALLIKAVTWSIDNTDICDVDKLFTINAGIKVHALVVIDWILSGDIVAISALLIPAKN